MKVIAMKTGFFDKLREPGEEFEVPDGMKGSWFVPVRSDVASSQTRAPTHKTGKTGPEVLV